MESLTADTPTKAKEIDRGIPDVNDQPRPQSVSPSPIAVADSVVAQPPSIPAPHPGDPPAASSHNTVTAEILQQLAELLRLFEDKIAGDQHRQQILDTLHKDMLDARQDLVVKIVRPVLLGIIRLYDDLGKSADKLDPADPARKTLLDHQQDAIDLLEDNAVERYSCPEEAFIPTLQTSLRTVPAPAPEDVGRIRERLKAGFRLGKLILRPEVVVIYSKSPGTVTVPTPVPPPAGPASGANA